MTASSVSPSALRDSEREETMPNSTSTKPLLYMRKPQHGFLLLPLRQTSALSRSLPFPLSTTSPRKPPCVKQNQMLDGAARLFSSWALQGSAAVPTRHVLCGSGKYCTSTCFTTRRKQLYNAATMKRKPRVMTRTSKLLL